MHKRTLKEQEALATLKTKQAPVLEPEDESDEDEELDEEEQEAIRKQSMAGLFLNFSVKKEGDETVKAKKKPPPLPPRGEISEDSMEDMVSDLDVDPIPTQMIDTKGHAGGAHSKNNLSIDTDTILKNAN